MGLFWKGGGAFDYSSICEWTINLSSHHIHQHALKSQPGVEQGTIMVRKAHLSIKMGSQKTQGEVSSPWQLLPPAKETLGGHCLLTVR